jgi:putative endonuclease
MTTTTWLARKRLNAFERALAGLDWLDRRRGSRMPPHLVLGMAGEDAAYFHLRRKGYTVVARRWSAGNLPGDIDLIALQGMLLCIVEVKTRSARDATPAEAAVDSHKRNTLRRLARSYVRQLPQDLLPQVRFDVMSVYLAPGKNREILHFENTFGWSERRERE